MPLTYKQIFDYASECHHRSVAAEACITEIESSLHANLTHRDRAASIEQALAHYRKDHAPYPDPDARESRRGNDVEPAPLPRCGDTVFHRPTGETWLVAWAHGAELAWTGWPEGTAHLWDCEVTERCSDQDHVEAVRRWARKTDSPRADEVMRLYGHVLTDTPA